MKSRGIYIHIPFCKAKCDYCNFISYKYNEAKVDEYINVLCKEIDLYSFELMNSIITSIYIGGGTPSVLTVEQISRLFQTLKPYYSDTIEITFEMNPESVTLDKLKKLKEIGVNRISIGIQSLHDNELKVLGRIHNASIAIDAIKKVSDMGFNYSVDFMYGFDKQRDIKKELEKVLVFNPQHISLYPLEIYEGLKISKKIAEIDDDFALKEYRLISNYLRKRGFVHYEVSNFALSGYESVHNSNYWKCKEYFGFGISAHGYVDSVRYQNEVTFDGYKEMVCQRQKPIKSKETISEEEKRLEFIMLGLRLSKGISIKEYEQKFNQTFHKLEDKSVLKHMKNGLLTLDNGYLKITEEGNYQMNNILLDLL